MYQDDPVLSGCRVSGLDTTQDLIGYYPLINYRTKTFERIDKTSCLLGPVENSSTGIGARLCIFYECISYQHAIKPIK